MSNPLVEGIYVLIFVEHAILTTSSSLIHTHKHTHKFHSLFSVEVSV